MPDQDRTLPTDLSRLGRRPLSRREFLALSSATLLGGILAACSNGDDGDETPVVSESPTTSTAPTPTATVAASSSPAGSPAADRSIAMFLALSSALTGFDELDDEDLAKVYLANLGDDGNALIDLYTKVGLDSPGTALSFDQVTQAGIFDDDALSALADRITVYWYSGKYQQSGGDVAVATFINALAWPATGYRLTGPSTCTGQTGVWATPPA